ncbi:MAG: LamG-like jellyroll fold domain-containing protein, partial [Candidatus Krumholzibacteriia bacterium]
EPQRVAGLDGNALRFDGVNDYVVVPDAPALRFSGSFTVEAWVRRLSTGTNDAILGKDGSSARNYRMRIKSTGHVELSWKDTSRGSRYTTSNTLILDSDWHHIACVHDQAAGEDRIYIDGMLDRVRADRAVPRTSDHALRIGVRRSSRLKDYFHGDIDLVRLSNRVMYTSDFTPSVPYPGHTPTPYVLVTWSKPESGGTPEGYHVYRSANAAPFERLTSTPVGGLNYGDTDVVDGVLAYHVTAVNGAGEEGAPGAAGGGVGGAGPPPPQPPPAPRVALVHHYEPPLGDAVFNFDEGTGPVVLDASGNSNQGTLGSSTAGDAGEPARVPGVRGSALRFDGSDDRVEVPDAPALRMGGSFTLEAWIHRVDTGEYGVMISKEGSSARNYRFSILSSGRLELYWKNTSGSTQRVQSTDVVPADTWHHVAAVHDQPAQESRVYLDGRLVGSAATSGPPATGSQRLRIGARQSSSSVKYAFAGTMDLVRITAAALYASDFSPPASYAGRRFKVHRVTWDAAEPGSAQIAGYQVYRSILDGAWERLTSEPATEMELNPPESLQVKTCYRVAAVDLLEYESDASLESCLYWKPYTLSGPLKAAPGGLVLQLRVGPNPFNPNTRISFRLELAQHVEAHIYSVAGRRVRTLVSGSLAAGSHHFLWDGRDARGRPLASGIYFMRLQASGETQTRKLVLAK